MSECEAGLWWYDTDKFSWQIFHTHVLIMGPLSQILTSWLATQQGCFLKHFVQINFSFLFSAQIRSDNWFGESLIFQSSRDSFVSLECRIGPNFDTVMPPAIEPLISSIMKSLYLTLSYFNCLLAVKINIESINKVG